MTTQRTRIDRTNAWTVTLKSGVTVLYSYTTPVAAKLCDGTYIRTRTHHSVTTTKHINRFVRGQCATVDPTVIAQPFQEN